MSFFIKVCPFHVKFCFILFLYRTCSTLLLGLWPQPFDILGGGGGGHIHICIQNGVSRSYSSSRSFLPRSSTGLNTLKFIFSHFLALETRINRRQISFIRWSVTDFDAPIFRDGSFLPKCTCLPLASAYCMVDA